MIAGCLGLFHTVTRGQDAASRGNDQFKETQMTSLAGRTIRWTFVDGPVAGITFEHRFGEDGAVTWRYVTGTDKGASNREKSYAAVRINDKTWAVSYLAASGHTLTVVLNLEDHRAIAFASDSTSWSTQNGTFEIVD
ncbi:MAG TPA: MoaF N-terminal domain-containing protein [Vicinamibacterales bacterium]